MKKKKKKKKKLNCGINYCALHNLIFLSKKKKIQLKILKKFIYFIFYIFRCRLNTQT